MPPPRHPSCLFRRLGSFAAGWSAAVSISRIWMRRRRPEHTRRCAPDLLVVRRRPDRAYEEVIYPFLATNFLLERRPHRRPPTRASAGGQLMGAPSAPGSTRRPRNRLDPLHLRGRAASRSPIWTRKRHPCCIWHGDTFDLPAGPPCRLHRCRRHQAFSWGAPRWRSSATGSRATSMERWSSGHAGELAAPLVGERLRGSRPARPALENSGRNAFASGSTGFGSEGDRGRRVAVGSRVPNPCRPRLVESGLAGIRATAGHHFPGGVPGVTSLPRALLHDRPMSFSQRSNMGFRTGTRVLPQRLRVAPPPGWSCSASRRSDVQRETESARDLGRTFHFIELAEIHDPVHVAPVIGRRSSLH